MNNKWANIIKAFHWIIKYKIPFMIIDNKVGARFEKWLVEKMYRQLGDWRGMKRYKRWDIVVRFVGEETLEEYEKGIAEHRKDEYKWERHPVYKNIVVEYWQPDNEYRYVILRKRL